jgi:PAS domain S-box-containing protein
MAKARILVVEDETIIAMEIENRLKNLGYIVPAVVSTGPAAIAKTAEVQPDLILMDIMLKGEMDGIEAAGQIRQRFGIPIVYLTAYADENILQRAKITQPAGYLLKPFEERELHIAIEMALCRHQQEKQLRHSEVSLAEAQRVARLGNWNWNISTNKLYWSDEVFRIFGLLPQEFGPTYEAFLNTVHADDRELVKKSIDEALRRNKPFSIDHCIVRADGEVRTVHAQGKVTFDESGQAIRMVGTVQDVTDRMLLEQRLAAIYKVGQELTLLHDEQTVVRRVLETAINSLNFEMAGCGLVDEAAGELAYRYYLVGGEQKTPGYCFSLAGEQSIGVAVVRSGQAIRLPDTTQDPRYVPIPDIPPGRSELCVPMQVKQQVIGVLNVESPQPNKFTSDDQQLLQTLATQTAVALENARLYTETQRRARELAGLNEAGRAMTSSLELNVVLAQVTTEVRSLLEAEGASVLLCMPNGNDLVFAAVAGSVADTLAGTSMSISEGIAGWAMRERQPVLVEDAQCDSRFYDGIDAVTGMVTRSMIAIPLIFQEKVIGIAEVINKAAGAFTQHDLELLGALSGSATIAIENARLYEAEREQYRRLQQSQTQLAQVQKMAALGRLVASIAHEINNPLQAVQTSLTLVQEELEDEQRLDKLQHYMGIAGGEIDRIAVIIRRMREFYRPACQLQDQDADLKDFYSSAKDELQTVHLHKLLDNVLLLTNKQLQHSRITVQCAWADALPPIQGNPDHLKQVFLNLVLNANDAMVLNGGVLHISTELVSPSILSTNGVERETEPMIRIKFGDTGAGVPPEVVSHLFEPLFTTKEQGSGFGLYTSYKIIEAHHGQITVESEEGAGTTFTILLPVQ